MKKNHLFLLGALAASVALFSFRRSSFQGVQSESALQVKWVKNGEALLSSGNNAKVELSAGNQKLHAFKIKMLEGNLNLVRCDVVFTDGNTTTITLRNDVQEGSESREILNPAPQSPIQKIILWYDSNRNQSRLEWWAKLIG